MIVFQKYILFKKRKNTSFFLCKFFLYFTVTTKPFVKSNLILMQFEICNPNSKFNQYYQILKKINFWKKTPYIWSFLKKKIKLNFD